MALRDIRAETAPLLSRASIFFQTWVSGSPLYCPKNMLPNCCELLTRSCATESSFILGQKKLTPPGARHPPRDSRHRKLSPRCREPACGYPKPGSRHPAAIFRHPNCKSRHPNPSHRYPELIGGYPATISRNPKPGFRYPKTIFCKQRLAQRLDFEHSAQLVFHECSTINQRQH